MSKGEPPFARVKSSPSGRKPTSRMLLASSSWALPQPGLELLMRPRRGEVVDFVGIGLQVVEFLGRLGVTEDVLGGRQFAFVMELFPHSRRRCLEHVIDVLSVNFVRHIRGARLCRVLIPNRQKSVGSRSGITQWDHAVGPYRWGETPSSPVLPTTEN